MGYLADVVYYYSGTECPTPFITWSALSLHAAILGRKIWTQHGMFSIYPNLYVALVGTAGSGKSTARGFSRRTMLNIFPQYMINENVQSYQDIAAQMALDDCIFTWKDDRGEAGPPDTIYNYRPFYAVVDELSLFMSVDIQNMISFLVNVHSDDDFGTGFKKDRGTKASSRFKNPYFNLLGCTIPDWMMMNLKYDLFTGGLGRRLCIVYENKTRYIDDPRTPDGADSRILRAIDHLKEHSTPEFHGRVYRTRSADVWWKGWYEQGEKRINREDPILKDYHETKHILLLKVATLIALDDYSCKKEMTDIHLQTALQLLDSLEPKIMRLTSGIGRNEIAGIASMMQEVVFNMGGEVTDKDLYLRFFRHLRQAEYEEAISFLVKTDKLIRFSIKRDGIDRWIVMTKERYNQRLHEQQEKSIK